MTNSEARRHLTGNMPTGEYRLSEVVVEDRPNESDWEQDAWVEIKDRSQLCEIMRQWALRTNMVANVNPLPATHGEYNMPRRCFIDQWHPAEAAIGEALKAVELLGADPLLTDAVTKLDQAKNLVADWLEGSVG